ncbi:uncharacterized protein BXZ73DRAFT_100475 [Epithele typhae]|uniref:uncharacterized protein n=1 Tax=Epithele typhae TaxID=378194 RepID=UPI0020074F89|nr:uncharacterized protein BXZ73DRAFT_100475 [Epithele typhae]KAH9936001.1 hypothetical protein BXZ73DRAFT_100475 [Epithele typhae]
MRERAKAMEDIVFFLVGKIEGAREHAKAILPTYPCAQPSDSAAFRIALAKYLDALRSVVTHAGSTHGGGDVKGKRPAHGAQDGALAWWWKDVVVRKSILDECSGERFERLILALSTHAVFKCTTRTAKARALSQTTTNPPSTLQSASTPADGQFELSTLPRGYARQLSAAQTSRAKWERSAAALLRQQHDLSVIRARIADPQLASASSKYDSLTTDRLLALRDSRWRDLLGGAWKGEGGRAALLLVTELAGLSEASGIAEASISSSSSGVEDEIGAEQNGSGLAESSQTGSQPPVPLPIAAAHHPAYVHSLSMPLLQTAKPSKIPDGDEPGDGASTSRPHAISERLADIERVQRSLQSALLSAQNLRTQLQQRLQKAQGNEAPRPSDGVVAKREAVHLDSRLWDRRAGPGVEPKKPPDASSLAQFGLAGAPPENAVEERIAHIRTALLPPFAAEPLPFTEHDPARPAPAPSRLPKPAPAPSQSTAAKPHHPAGTRHPPPNRVPSKQVRLTAPDGGTASKASARRLSRRASAAHTRRSTTFGRGDDAEIWRIVNSVQDRSSDSSDANDSADGDGHEGEGEGDPDQSSLAVHFGVAPQRTPGDRGTRGALLSGIKRSGPRASFDIERYERVPVPRLPSLRLESAAEVDEDEGQMDIGSGHRRTVEEEKEDEEIYEGNSMTLADILLQAGHQANVSGQLLGEDEVDGDMSEWE